MIKSQTEFSQIFPKDLQVVYNSRKYVNICIYGQSVDYQFQKYTGILEHFDFF